jgi:hypothetical protein
MISKPRLRCVFATALVVVGLAPSEAAAADTIWTFSTPSNAAYCGSNLPRSRSEEAIHCYRPSDGLDLWIGRTGRPKAKYVPSERGKHVQTFYHRHFGQFFSINGINCLIRKTGLTCTNPANHGWWLGPTKGYRLF